MGLNTFQLDSRLETESTFVIDLMLCQVRLSHNAAFPWILLIPKESAVVEIIDLSSTNQQVLMQEIFLASQIMRALFQPTKLNIASLGNIVPQLHVHVIARYITDKAWPAPIWNSGITAAYDSSIKIERINQLKEAFLSSQQIPIIEKIRS